MAKELDKTDDAPKPEEKSEKPLRPQPRWKPPVDDSEEDDLFNDMPV